MNMFFDFIASPLGRGIRIVVGLALIAAGLFFIEGVAGWIVAAAGVVPLAAGLFDVCVLAPLARLPFVGDKLRTCVRAR
jgi:hypothetical protein